MMKSKFTNPAFYWAIISLLGCLLLWNLHLSVTQSKLVGLLPIAIQATLLVLIFKRHEFAKNGIKTWAIVFLIIGSGLQFSGKLVNDLTNNFTNTDFQYYLITVLSIIVGILIVIYTNKTVKVVEKVEEQAKT